MSEKANRRGLNEQEMDREDAEPVEDSFRSQPLPELLSKYAAIL